MERAIVFGEQDVAGHVAIEEHERSNVERCGYGACSQCTCRGYVGSGDLCGNSQHNYSFHW